MMTTDQLTDLLSQLTEFLREQMTEEQVADLSITDLRTLENLLHHCWRYSRDLHNQRKTLPETKGAKA